MILNHLNLTVVSPEETSAFLAKYFDLQPGGGNAGMQLMRDESGMVLTLMKASAEGVKYPGSFHIGFIQPSRQRVDDINARLAADGFQVPAPSIQHGSYTFYFTAPGGFTIEVMG